MKYIPKLYVYVVTDDDNASPHTRNGRTTFCLCKPFIRKVALPGDVIVGVLSKGLSNLLNERLGTKNRKMGDILFLAVVDGVTPMKEYCRKNKDRHDALYSFRYRNGIEVLQKKNPYHEAENMFSDLYGWDCLEFSEYYRFVNNRMKLSDLLPGQRKPARNHRTYKLSHLRRRSLVAKARRARDKRSFHIGTSSDADRRKNVESFKRGLAYPYVSRGWQTLFSKPKAWMLKLKRDRKRSRSRKRRKSRSL